MQVMVVAAHPDVLPQLRQELVRLLRTYRPERVLTHDPFVRSGSLSYQLHPDHRAAGDAALQAAYPCAGGSLCYPAQVAAGLKPHKVRELYLLSLSRLNHRQPRG